MRSGWETMESEQARLPETKHRSPIAGHGLAGPHLDSVASPSLAHHQPADEPVIIDPRLKELANGMQ